MARSVAGVAASLCTAPLMTGVPCAQAQAPAPPPAPAPKKGWESSINAGLTLTRGNSESVQVTIGAQTQRKWDRDEVFLNAAFGYGQTEDPATGADTKSADFVTAGAQWNHLFTPKLYGGLKLDFRHDDVADLDYRFTISPLIGYYVVKTERHSFNVEAGPSAVFEKQGGDEKNYIALRFAERSEHKIGNKAKVWQALEYLPQVDDFGNYILNFEAGIESAVTKAISLRLVALDNYDNEPAPGREKNDFKLIAGIAYKF
jgi:putative salt-induced outer membrane protein YdiY